MCASKSYVTGNAMCLDSLDENIDANFLMHYLRGYDFGSIISGSAQPQITRASLRRVMVPVLSKEDQLEFCRGIQSIEKTSNRLCSLLLTLDSLVKSRFVEVFGDPSSNPKGYPMVRLSDIAIYYGGLTYAPVDVAEVGTVVLRSNNIQGGSLDLSGTIRVNCNIKEKYYVKDNDILMCSRNGSAKLVGKTALISNLDEPMVFGAFMMIVRSEYYPYLLSYFDHPAFKSQISTGTATINQITRRMLDDVLLPLPPKLTVDEFQLFLQQVDKLRFAGKS